jgi:cell division septal protein FtsQ
MKFLNKLKLFLFLSFFCSLFFTALFFVNQFFLIKKIELISDRKFLLYNKDELINKNIIFIDQDKIAKKIILENSLLKQAVVNKVWPATLKVEVSFYEPITALVVNQGFFYLSEDGRILSKIKDNQLQLPVINYYQKLNNSSFQTGDWIDYKDIQQALFFIDKLEQINLLPLTIDIKGQDMLVFNLNDDRKIVFSNRKEKELQNYQLSLIVRQFKIEGKEFKKIDLRFEKPIITF